MVSACTDGGYRSEGPCGDRAAWCISRGGDDSSAFAAGGFLWAAMGQLRALLRQGRPSTVFRDLQRRSRCLSISAMLTGVCLGVGRGWTRAALDPAVVQRSPRSGMSGSAAETRREAVPTRTGQVGMRRRAPAQPHGGARRGRIPCAVADMMSRFVAAVVLMQPAIRALGAGGPRWLGVPVGSARGSR